MRKKFECIRCGRCCNEVYIFPLIKKKEWKRIIEYLKAFKNCVLEIVCDCGCEQVSKFHLTSVENIENAIQTQNDLFWAMDYGKCSFLRFNKKRDYVCEIYDIRPSVCRTYRCDIEIES